MRRFLHPGFAFFGLPVMTVAFFPTLQGWVASAVFAVVATIAIYMTWPAEDHFGPPK